MATTVKEIVSALEIIAPAKLAEPWDNIGLLCGSPNATVSKIVISLDLTMDVVAQAVRESAEMIIVHHPPIYKPISQILDDDPSVSAIIAAIRSQISVYCAHTNLDRAKQGIVTAKCLKLNLQPGIPLLPSPTDKSSGLGTLCQLDKPISTKDLLSKIKIRLNSTCILHSHVLPEAVSRIAIFSGAAGDALLPSYEAGAQITIVGELKYHDWLTADNLQLPVITVGHYESEIPGMQLLLRSLQTCDFDVKYIVAQTQNSYALHNT